MSLRTVFGLGTTLLVVLVACDGAVVLPGNGTASGSSGSNGGSSSGISSSSGQGGTSGSSGTCSLTTLPADRVCVLGTAPSNTVLHLQMDASEGCIPCFTTINGCSVTTLGDHIVLAMAAQTCQPMGDVGCPDICGLPQTTCDVPGLPPGKYTIEVQGEKPRGGLPPRELVVTDERGTDSCKLPGPGQDPRPIDGSLYGKSCSADADCRLAIAGDVCSSCACPNLAISTSSSAFWEADYRERTSQCLSNGAQPKCGPCVAVKATCALPPDGLPGTCVLGNGP